MLDGIDVSVRKPTIESMDDGAWPFPGNGWVHACEREDK